MSPRRSDMSDAFKNKNADEFVGSPLGVSLGRIRILGRFFQVFNRFC